ncbi:MAG: hypothetical protein U0414_41645 [Polyangiaceae bacterium]
MKLSIASPVVVLVGPPVARSVSAVVAIVPVAHALPVVRGRVRVAPEPARSSARGRRSRTPVLPA